MMQDSRAASVVVRRAHLNSEFRIRDSFKFDGREPVEMSNFPVFVRRGCEEMRIAVRAGGSGSEVMLLDVIWVGDLWTKVRAYFRFR